MDKNLKNKLDLELEPELGDCHEDMGDVILTLDSAGKAVCVEVEDDPDPEETEEPTDVEYD